MTTTTEFQLVDINKLVPYANNARTHNKEQILKLRSSLREFGFVNPVIIDKDYNVLAGHGRIQRKACRYGTYQCHIRKIMSLDDHLSSHQNVRLMGCKGRKNYRSTMCVCRPFDRSTEESVHSC